MGGTPDTAGCTWAVRACGMAESARGKAAGRPLLLSPLPHVTGPVGRASAQLRRGFEREGGRPRGRAPAGDGGDRIISYCGLLCRNETWPAGRSAGAAGHLGEDAADAPDVGRVGEAGEQQRLRRSILARADDEGRLLRGVNGGAEVDKADAGGAALAAAGVEEHVLGLAVGVDDAFSVYIIDGF